MQHKILLMDVQPTRDQYKMTGQEAFILGLIITFLATVALITWAGEKTR